MSRGSSKGEVLRELEDGESCELMSWCLREAIDDGGGLDGCRRGWLGSNSKKGSAVLVESSIMAIAPGMGTCPFRISI